MKNRLPSFETKLDDVVYKIEADLEDANWHPFIGLPGKISDAILKHTNYNYELAYKIMKNLKGKMVP